MYNCESSLFITIWRQVKFVYNFQHIKSLRNGNRKPTKRNKLLTNKHHSEFFVPSGSSLGSSEGCECNPNGALTPPGPVFMLPRFVNSTEPKLHSNHFHLLSVMTWLFSSDSKYSTGMYKRSWDSGRWYQVTKGPFSLPNIRVSGTGQEAKALDSPSLSASLLVSPNLSRFEGLPTSNIPTARRALLSKHQSKRARHCRRH